MSTRKSPGGLPVSLLLLVLGTVPAAAQVLPPPGAAAPIEPVTAQPCNEADADPSVPLAECPAVTPEPGSAAQPPQQHFYHRLLILLRLLDA